MHPFHAFRELRVKVDSPSSFHVKSDRTRLSMAHAILGHTDVLSHILGVAVQDVQADVAPVVANVESVTCETQMNKLLDKLIHVAVCQKLT